MKQNKWTILLITLLVLALAACNSGGTIVDTEPANDPTTEPVIDGETNETETETTSNQAETGDQAPAITDTVWVLESYPDSNGTAVNLLPNSSITLNFADGGINGNASCNNYFGSYTLDGQTITFGPLGSTEMFCEETMEQENAYLTTLGTVSQYRIDGGKLILSDDAGNDLLTFSAQEAPTAVELNNTVWLLNSIINGDVASSIVAGSRLTAVFDTDGNLTGHSGCNSFGGAYTVDGQTVTIGDLASTLMACMDDALMQQETAYHAALHAVASYKIDGQTLQLLDADGNLLLTFNAEEPKALSGTAWEVTSINNGNEAVVSLIEGTAVTANFGIDGNLSGSAGCNSYTTAYTVDGDTITIQPAGVTKMMCQNPEGLMQQEAQFLAALETVRTYKIDGDQLQLRTADGAIALTLHLANPEVGP